MKNLSTLVKPLFTKKADMKAIQKAVFLAGMNEEIQEIEISKIPTEIQKVAVSLGFALDSEATIKKVAELFKAKTVPSTHADLLLLSSALAEKFYSKADVFMKEFKLQWIGEFPRMETIKYNTGTLREQCWLLLAEDVNISPSDYKQKLSERLLKDGMKLPSHRITANYNLVRKDVTALQELYNMVGEDITTIFKAKTTI